MALLRTFIVADTSMRPELSPGDRVLVTSVGGYKPGQVVVLRDPEATQTFLLKRIQATGKDALEVRGDNPNVSRDSRHFGPVPRALIVGRVIWRYHHR